jgi:hypothetical protein
VRPLPVPGSGISRLPVQAASGDTVMNHRDAKSVQVSDYRQPTIGQKLGDFASLLSFRARATFRIDCSRCLFWAIRIVIIGMINLCRKGKREKAFKGFLWYDLIINLSLSSLWE